MYIVGITTISGSVFMLVWLIMKFLLGRVGFAGVLYKMLQSLTLFFLLPVFYIVFYFANVRTDTWHGKLFLWTPNMVWGMQICFLAWIIGVLVCFGRYLWKVYMLHKRLEDTFPLAENVYRRYDELCIKLGIKVGKISLVGLDEETAPFSVGLIHPKIILPLEKYSQEQLDVILIHELTHFLHRDIVYKHLLQVVCSLNFFNPLVWILRKQSDIWCEHACDSQAWGTYGSAKEYARILSEICMKGYRREVLGAGIVADKGGIVERTMRMKRLSTRKTETKWMAALVAMAILVFGTVGTTTVLAAAANQYVEYYDENRVEIDETEEIQEYVEYTGSISDWEDKNVIEGEVMSTYAEGSVMRFSWTVPVNTIKKTPSLYCKAGQYIDAQAIFTPSDQQVRLGIIEPNGTTRFLQGESSFSHSFKLNKTGYYYVFVENINDNNSISAVGQYRWKD